MTDPLLYDTKGAAAVLSVSPSFLEALRVKKTGPAYIKIKGRGRYGVGVRYTPEALQAWVDAQVKK